MADFTFFILRITKNAGNFQNWEEPSRFVNGNLCKTDKLEKKTSQKRMGIYEKCSTIKYL